MNDRRSLKNKSDGVAETFLKAYCATAVSTFLWYPYRDYIKESRWPPNAPSAGFFLARYQGFVENPSQLVILSSSSALLYAGYNMMGDHSVMAPFAAGSLHGLSKSMLRMLSLRMGTKKRNGELRFSSLWDCIRTMTREQGVLSWFSGASAMMLISCAWHGSALVSLSSRSRYPPNFARDWWEGFRAHAFLCFVTTPIRNSFRSALHPIERSGGVQSMAAFVQGEIAIFKEAAGVAPAMLRTQGVSFFLHGCLRNTLKSSLPFGFTYAVFRTVDGCVG